MEWFLTDLSILIVCAALFSYLAVLAKQPIIIAYIFCGALIGPWGLGWIKNVEFMSVISKMGITLLLFLAGAVLHPQHLVKLFRRSSIVVFLSCASSFVIAFLGAALFKFSLKDSLFIGLAFMFSSTILVVKLIPTTKLHQAKIGEICIGILIAEDLIAIALLTVIKGFSLILFLKLFLVMLSIYLFEQFILRKIITRVDRFHETIFIIGLAWCLGAAWFANWAGLSYEIGAFLAGVALARNKISLFITEKLKPLRDFFLVLFFFVLGAKINFFILGNILLPAALLAVIFCAFKPILLINFFRLVKEEKKLANEASVRLGQLSEFSLLIAIAALSCGYISENVSQFIQLAAIFSMVISTYLVILKYPTPIGTSERLIQD